MVGIMLKNKLAKPRKDKTTNNNCFMLAVRLFKILGNCFNFGLLAICVILGL